MLIVAKKGQHDAPVSALQTNTSTESTLRTMLAPPSALSGLRLAIYNVPGATQACGYERVSGRRRRARADRVFGRPVDTSGSTITNPAISHHRSPPSGLISAARNHQIASRHQHKSHQCPVHVLSGVCIWVRRAIAAGIPSEDDDLRVILLDRRSSLFRSELGVILDPTSP